jgi:hypothetical protein
MSSAADHASSSDGKVPQFPDDLTRFDEYKIKMEACFAARDLLPAIMQPSRAVTHTARLPDNEYAQWLNNTTETCERAELVLRAAKAPQDIASAMRDESVMFRRDIIRCRKAADIIISSLKEKQITLIACIFPANSFEMWRAITTTYGPINTTDTTASLLTQFEEFKKHDNEKIGEYTSRLDKIISQLKTNGTNIDIPMKKHRILRGLQHISKWTQHVQIIQKLDRNNEWNMSELERYLISEENKQTAESQNSKGETATAHTTFQNNNQHSTSSTTQSPFAFRGRGNYRGRGQPFVRGRGQHYRGRGQFPYRGGRGGQQQQQQQTGDQAQPTRGGGFRGNFRGRGFRGRGNGTHYNTYRQTITCFNCGKPGHKQEECWSKRQKTEDSSAHVTISSEPSEQENQQQEQEQEYAFMMNDCEDVPSEDWILDSGATRHHTGDISLLYNVRTLQKPGQTVTGNGKSTYNQVGDIDIKYNDKTITLKDVIYIHGFNANIISTNVFTNQGYRFIVDSSHARIETATGDVLLSTNSKSKTANLYVIKQQQHQQVHATSSTTSTTELQQLHAKYGHVSMNKLIEMIKNDSINDITNSLKHIAKKSNIKVPECESCIRGKMTRSPLTGTINYKTQQPLDVIAADVMGPFRPTSLSNYKYILIIIDIHTRTPQAFLLKTKGEASSKIIEYIKYMQTQYERNVKRFNSDGGKEIVNKELIDYLRENGTAQTNTTPSTPEHNAIVERMNRTIMGMTKSMLIHSGVSKKLWDEATMMAVYLLRRCTNKNNPRITPLELITQQKPSIKHLHTFGCDVHYLIQKENRQTKLDENARKGIFVGYGANNDTYYRIYDREKNKIIISRDVKFNEQSFTEAHKMKEEEERMDVQIDNENEERKSE